MAWLTSAQRRLGLVLAAIVFTLLIRLLSLFPGHGHDLRAGQAGFFISDKGPFKQAVLRIRRRKTQASYLIRVANFSPFVTIENFRFLNSRRLANASSSLTVTSDCGDDCECADCVCECAGGSECECECGDCDCDCDCDCLADCDCDCDCSSDCHADCDCYS